MVINVDWAWNLATKATFLHNTEIVSSKMAEDKSWEKDKEKP